MRWTRWNFSWHCWILITLINWINWINWISWISWISWFQNWIVQFYSNEWVENDFLDNFDHHNHCANKQVTNILTVKSKFKSSISSQLSIGLTFCLTEYTTGGWLMITWQVVVQPPEERLDQWASIPLAIKSFSSKDYLFTFISLICTQFTSE